MQSRENEKLVLVGDSQVGKSSLMSCFLNKSYAKVQPTESLSFELKKIEVNEETVRVEIWDTPGNVKPLDSHCAGATGIILVYDITNYKSFKNIENYWLKQVEKYRESSDCQLALVGTKYDEKRNQQVDDPEAQAFAEKHKITMISTKLSAKDNEDFNVNTFFDNFIEEIRKPFAKKAPILPSIIKPGVKKEIDVSHIPLKNLIKRIANREWTGEDLKQIAQKKNLKEDVLNHLKALEKKSSYPELDEIFLLNQKHSGFEAFFEVSRGWRILFWSETTKDQFETLKEKWNLNYLHRTKREESKKTPIALNTPSARSSLYDAFAPVAPRQLDAKTVSFAPLSKTDFNKRTKEYLEELKGKLTVAERIAELKLTKEEKETEVLKKFIDPITKNYIAIPVSLYEISFDLNTLLRRLQEGNNQHPTLLDENFTIKDIQPNRTLLKEFEEIINKLKEDRAKNVIGYPAVIPGPQGEAKENILDLPVEIPGEQVQENILDLPAEIPGEKVKENDPNDFVIEFKRNLSKR